MRMSRWYLNPLSHALNVDTVRLKRCLLNTASSTTSAKAVGRCYTPIKVIAVFTVPLAQHHARQFKKHVRKGMVQHPVVNLNTRFRPKHVVYRPTRKWQVNSESGHPVTYSFR